MFGGRRTATLARRSPGKREVKSRKHGETDFCVTSSEQPDEYACALFLTPRADIRLLLAPLSQVCCYCRISQA